MKLNTGPIVNNVVNNRYRLKQIGSFLGNILRLQSVFSIKTSLVLIKTNLNF